MSKIKSIHPSNLLMPKLFKTCLLVITIFGSTYSSAQTLDDASQEIVKEFEAQLEDAERVVVKPIIQPIVVSKKTYKYNVTIIPLDLKYPDPVIKPLAADPDLPFDSKSLYLQLGYGNLKNPKAYVKYYNTDQNKLDYYFDLGHVGLDNTKKVAFQSMSHSEVNAGFKYRMKENLQINFHTNALYDQRKVYFKSVEGMSNAYHGKAIRNTQLSSTFELFNPELTDSKFDYNIKFGYNMASLLSYSNKSEFSPFLNIRLAKALGKWKLEMPLYSRAVLENDVKDLYSISFEPHIKMSNHKLWLKGGIALFSDNQLKSKVWPSIHVDYAINKQFLHVFALSSQETWVNSLQRISLINPWVSPKQNSITNNLVQRIGAGVKSTTLFLGVEAEVGFTKIFNQAHFVNNEVNALEIPKIALQNMNAVYIKANVDFAFSNHITLGGNLIKNFYTENIYAIPSMELKSFAKMKFIKGRLVITPTLTIRDKSTAKISSVDGDQIINLNSQVELSANTTIHFSKKIGIYFEANNILNNLYQPIYGYPVTGIYFNGGLIVKI